MIKKWNDIPEYEGIYQVSNFGEVKNVKHGRILRQCRHRLGYMSVMLYKSGTPKRMMIHRLVALAFLENPDGLEFVNHKDENKANNHVDNLEWCSREYNAQYGTSGQRIANKRRTSQTNHSRKVIQQDEFGNVLKVWNSIADASRNTKTARTSIFECCNGIHRTSNGFKWAHAE